MTETLRNCWICSLVLVLLVPLCVDAQLKKSNLKKADREQWSAVLKIPSDCEESFAKTEGQETDNSGLEFHRLDSGEYLVSVECYPGAYQPGNIFFLLDEHPTPSAKLLKFEGFDSQDENGKPLPYSMVDGFSFFSHKQGTLEILSKYWGMGDCGRFARYRYRGGRFTLLELREQECKQSGSTNYRHWPINKNP